VKKPFSFSKFFIVSQTLIVLILGAMLSWYFGYTVFESEKSALINRIYNVAKTMDASVVEGLAGNETDLENSKYIYLKKKLFDLKSVNTDAKFLYIMGYDRDISKLFFFVDSETPDSISTYSPPGSVYEESSNLEIDNFLRGVAFAEGPYKDAWGRWVSAYAPIISEKSGLPIAIVGIDVDAHKFIQEIVIASLLPFIISIILAILLFIFHKIRMREKSSELNNIKMEFTSFMSHEIRGFVTKIKGGLRALTHEDFGILTADQASYITDLMGQSDEFGNLIEEFLDIGHLEQDSEISLSKGDYNLLDIIKGVVGDAKEALAKKDIGVVYEGNVPDKVYCICDNNKVGRVFSNIITNAIKYSAEKSSIHVGYIDANTSHTIYIKDSGIGIPDSEKNNMFKKFFRATNARDIHTTGTGLGLYFSKLIVEKHGGKIWFESIEGNGTTFYISLPKN
jgi:signal transduction histidine kinase